MEDNSVDPDIRSQAEAVYNYMNHVGKSVGPVGVKTALEWTTHEGKDFDFVKNQRTERTEPSREAAEKKEENEDEE